MRTRPAIITAVRSSIVHRDISPHNVLMTRYGEVKLVDFGLAKASSHLTDEDEDIVKGKFGYLAPEVTLGQRRGSPRRHLRRGHPAVGDAHRDADCFSARRTSKPSSWFEPRRSRIPANFAATSPRT